jgi:Zn-dependent protease
MSNDQPKINLENNDKNHNNAEFLNNNPLENNIEIIKKKKSKTGILGLLGVIGALLLKFKFIIILVLSKLKYLLVLLKFSKFSSTFISMFITIFIYAKLYGFYFGIGFVTLILVHEIGHYVVAKYLNLNVSGPVFIPFIGALISMKETPKDAVVEAKIAFGGPILGSFASFICLYIGLEFELQLLLALSYMGFFINIFNLIPIIPMDGGRIVKAISPKIWFIGIPILIILMITYFSPIMLLIIIMGIYEVVNYFKNKNSEYYNVPTKLRTIFSITYISLISALTASIFYVHEIIKF